MIKSSDFLDIQYVTMVSMLRYQPEEGSIVMCDFRGFVVPEMVKVRHVVIIHKHRENKRLVAIIPISTTPPPNVKDYHYLFAQETSLKYFNHTSCWVKCDMVSVVSTDRLYPIAILNSEVYKVEREIFETLKKKVANALGLSHLSKRPDEPASTSQDACNCVDS